MKRPSVVEIIVFVLMFGVGIWIGTKYGHFLQSAALAKTAVASLPSNIQPTAPAPMSIFLVAIGDGKTGNMFGCGDALLPVPTQATTAQTALEALFAIHTQAYGSTGLTTSLYANDLTIKDVSTSRIDLTGTFNLGGECDDPRAETQINATVHQFPGFENTPVYVNGETLQDALSLK